MPDNVGKYMRKLVIGSIRAAAERAANASAAAAAGPEGGNAPGLFPGGGSEGTREDEDIYGESAADELNICCHGRAAAPEVRPRFLMAAARHTLRRGFPTLMFERDRAHCAYGRMLQLCCYPTVVPAHAPSALFSSSPLCVQRSTVQKRGRPPRIG